MIKSAQGLILLFLFLFSSMQAFALDAPAACPTVDAIKNAGLSGVMEDKRYNVYAVYQISRYSTPTTWGFFIAVPSDQAISREDATNKAKEALRTVSGQPNPTAVDDTQKRWYCWYDNAYHYVSVAVTPLMGQAEIKGAMQTRRQ